MRPAVVKPVVVKLGGSTAEGAELRTWISALAGASVIECENTPTPNPSPQGGGGRWRCSSEKKSTTLAPCSARGKSPSPLWGGDRGGGKRPRNSISDRPTQTIHPLVIVPGGGPFAELVRVEQKRMGFSDEAAHAMAILAMDAFGCVILDGQARMAPARSLDEMERVLGEQKIPVWLPASMTLGALDIPASWDITSDSLAAWLAGRIGAETLLLIKQTQAFSAEDVVADLMARGIVDSAFGAMLPSGIDLLLAGPADAAGGGRALAAGTLPGIRIGSAAGPLRRAG